MRSRLTLPLFLLALLLGTLASAGPSRSPEEPINVLFLSFGNRDQPAFNQLVEEFRAGLEREDRAPIHIYVETFDEYRAANDPSFDRAMEQFLGQKYAGRKLDLLVAVGGRPLDFLLLRRAKLFPGARLLYSTVFREPVADATGVILQLNLLPTVDLALQQNPGTKRVLLITGSSPADQTGIPELVGALKAKFQREGRAIAVETLPPMSYAEARRRLAGLPRDTVCVFVFYFMDSAGQILTTSRVLPVFSRVSTRPIYSGWDIDVGRGSVGGRVISVTAIGQTLAEQAARLLRGEDPSAIPPVRGEFQRYMFDWQQMQRWGIRLDQLPPDSTVINREYTVWERYKWQIGGGAALIVVETALILLLFRLWSVRRRAEQQARQSEQAIRDLSGRLITAQEEERSRIARELHDDINQQLALLAIDLQRIEGSLPGDAHAAHALLHELWKKTNGVSADIQRISHQLHSAKLEHLGLISALRGLCNEFSRQQKIGIEFQATDAPSHLDRGVALGLFRIAQECLRNAGKHSQAKNVRVELAGENGSVVLRVSDDGMGFDPERLGRAGLGMVSMQERIRLVGGKLRVTSARSSGTEVEATVPLPAAPGRESALAGAGRKA